MSSTEQDVASPAAAVLERRPSRTTQEKRKQPCGDSESEGSETGSDGEWSGDDDPLSDHGREDEDEDEEETVLRGRVRPHAAVQVSNDLELDDGRHKSLAEKGWARRAVVVRGLGPCGGADLEELPGREEYGGDEDGALDWAAAALRFAEENFNDNGAEVRSLDQRDCKVGLFGDFCERVGHGKFVEWQPDEEHGGLYALKVVTKVRAACSVLRCALGLTPGLRHWQVVEGERGQLCEVPVVPSWAAVMEYVVKAATGHPTTPKGGKGTVVRSRARVVVK